MQKSTIKVGTPPSKSEEKPIVPERKFIGSGEDVPFTQELKPLTEEELHEVYCG